jgi:hypothetical protein
VRGEEFALIDHRLPPFPSREPLDACGFQKV